MKPHKFVTSNHTIYSYKHYNITKRMFERKIVYWKLCGYLQDGKCVMRENEYPDIVKADKVCPAGYEKWDQCPTHRFITYDNMIQNGEV